MNQPKQKKGSSLYNAQTRRNLAMAEREELRNRQLKGELVRKDVVEREWFQLIRQVRDGLENVPARTAGLVAAESNQDACFAIIEKEIRQALEAITAGGAP